MVYQSLEFHHGIISRKTNNYILRFFYNSSSILSMKRFLLLKPWKDVEFHHGIISHFFLRLCRRCVSHCEIASASNPDFKLIQGFYSNSMEDQITSESFVQISQSESDTPWLQVNQIQRRAKIISKICMWRRSCIGLFRIRFKLSIQTLERHGTSILTKFTIINLVNFFTKVEFFWCFNFSVLVIGREGRGREIQLFFLRKKREVMKMNVQVMKRNGMVMKNS